MYDLFQNIPLKDADIVKYNESQQLRQEMDSWFSGILMEKNVFAFQEMSGNLLHRKAFYRSQHPTVYSTQ